MRVTNAQGKVKVPADRLIDLLTVPMTNENLKLHATNQIFDFIFTQYRNSFENSDLIQQFLKPIVAALPQMVDGTHQKSSLFVLLIHTLKNLSNKLPKNEFVEIISSSFQKEGKELLSCIYQFILSIQYPEALQIQILQTQFTQCLQFMSQNFENNSSLNQCQVQYLSTIIKLLGTRQQKTESGDPFVIPIDQCFPLLALLEQSTLGSVANEAQIITKSWLQDYDRTQNPIIATSLFKMILNLNIYKNEETSLLEEEKELPILAQKGLIDILIKFDLDGNPQLLTKLLEKCNTQAMVHYAVRIIESVIKNSGHMLLSGQADLFDRLLHSLQKIQVLETDNSDYHQQRAKATVYTILADLARLNFTKVFGKNMVPSLSHAAIEAFETLTARMHDIEIIRKPVREDDICLILLEALNKFRSLIEQLIQGDQSHEETKTFLQEKEILASLLEKTMAKELIKLKRTNIDSASSFINGPSQASNEMIYILLLYLISLQSFKDFNQVHPSILFYSCTLKEHEDIKIRKEAQKQIEIFEKNLNQIHRKQEFTKTFEHELNKFLNRQNLNSEELVKQAQNNQFDQLNADLGLQSNGFQWQSNMVETISQISRIYLQLTSGEDDLTSLEIVILFNLNMTFTRFKSDFSKEIQLLIDFVKKFGGKQLKVIANQGVKLIMRHLKLTSDLQQKIQAMKFLALAINSLNVEMNEEQQITIILNQDNSAITKYSHELLCDTAIMVTLFALSFKDSQKQELLIQWLNREITRNLEEVKNQFSPNIKQQTRVLLSCLQELSKNNKFIQNEFLRTFFSGTTQYIIDLLTVKGFDVLEDSSQDKQSKEASQKAQKKDLLVVILKTLAKVMKRVTPDESKLNYCQQVLKLFLGKPCEGYQIYAGKVFSKVLPEQKLEQFTNFFILKMLENSGNQDIEWSFGPAEEEKMETSDQYQSSLQTRRIALIYLSTILKSKHSFVNSNLVNFQKVFLRYMFDMKPMVCETASESLTLVYQMGDADIKQQLVASLAKALSGDEKNGVSNIQNEINDKSEDRELILTDSVLGASVQVNKEQKQKLQTYKDLCKIAVEIGQKDLIYQFMEVHRHLAHYQGMSRAAQGLSSIIMLDEGLKAQLRKITPKILLLTHDYNREVRETMQQLWSTMVPVEEESRVLEEKWPEILKECLDNFKAKEFRKRLSACLLLAELVPSKTWEQIEANFKELFLGTLALTDDDIDKVKQAATDLAKANRTILLKHANIYSNSNITQLKQILDLTIPMLFDQVIDSNIKQVKFYGVNILFEIVKSSTQERMYQALKLQNNKYERQLAFSYNSEQVMRQILNDSYLDKIIIKVLQNLSQMNKGVEMVNYYEQYAIGKGVYESGNLSGPASAGGISETDINQMRIKLTRESDWGEILAICRKQMFETTFDKILPELMHLMIKGHDLVTKSTAISFLQDIILENRQKELIQPKNAKKVAEKILDYFIQNSPQTLMTQTKFSLVQLYASCLGLLFKIIRDFPQSTNDLIQKVINDIPNELEIIKTLMLLEIVKNLSYDQLKAGGANGELIVQNAVPMIYINRYRAVLKDDGGLQKVHEQEAGSVNDTRLRDYSMRLWRVLKEAIVDTSDESHAKNFDLEIKNKGKIIFKIQNLLQSNNYEERISGAMALETLSSSVAIDYEDITDQATLKSVLDTMQNMLAQKYHERKELIVDSFINILQSTDCLAKRYKNGPERDGVLDLYFKQMNKSLNVNYKNKLVELANLIIPFGDTLEIIIEMIFQQLPQYLQNMTEGEGDIENRKEEDKQVLCLIQVLCLQLALLLKEFPEQIKFRELFIKYYSFSNYHVRSSFLKAVLKIQSIDWQLIQHVFEQFAQLGEKYELNLLLLSDLALLAAKNINQLAIKDKLENNLMLLIKELKDKGGEKLIKNCDQVLSYLNK